MDNKLNYQQARRIRGQSLSDLFAEQLITGQDFLPGLKKTIGLKTQARIKGIKEKFDPLNIARALTGGSRLGPALVGRLLGRSRKDIEYFAGRARPVGDRIGNMTGIYNRSQGGESTSGLKAGLSKILNFLEKSRDTNIKMLEKENDFKELKEIEEQRRHNELMKALNSLIGKKETNKIESGGPGLMDFFGSLKEKLQQRAADKAKSIAEKKAAEAAAKAASEKVVTTVGETALSKGEQAVAEKATQTAEKVLAKDVGEATIKSKAKQIVGNALGKIAGSKVPLIGLAFTAEDVWSRIKSGDNVGAVISATSGLAASLPGAGTAASAALDVSGLTRDVYNAVYGDNQFEKDMINDPERTKERFAFIGNLIKPMVTSALSNKEDTAVPQAPEGMEIDATGNVNSSPPQIPKASTPQRVPKGQASRMAAPVSEIPKSQELNSAIESNNDLNLDSKVAGTENTSTTTNVQAPEKSPNGYKPQPGFASVRNQDDTLQRLLLDSIRVV